MGELKDAKWGQREGSGERIQPPEVRGLGPGVEGSSVGLGKTPEAGQAGHGNGREALGAQSLGLYCGEEYTGDQAGGLALLAAEQGLGAGPGWHLHCWV